MRVLIVGDSHIGAVFGLGGYNGRGGNTRVDDYNTTLNTLADYAIQEKVDVFIQTGDIFEERDPKPEHMNIVSNVLQKLSAANILTIVIMGNHDFRRVGEVFTSAITSLQAKDHTNIRLLLEPQIINFKNKDNESVNLLMVPFRDRREYEGSNIKERSLKYDEHMNELIDGCNDDPIIMVGHNHFYDGNYMDYGELEILTNYNSFDRCDLVVMGHLHQFRVLKDDNPTAIYIGSMEKQNFGDVDSDKYFIDYNVENKSAKILKIPSRQLFDGSIDLTSCSLEEYDDIIYDEIIKLDIDEKIVRLKLIIKDNLHPILKKNVVEKMLYENGAFYVSNILTEVIHKRVVRDEAILDGETDVDVFEAFVKSQGIEETIRDELLFCSKEIMSSRSEDEN